MIRSLGGKGGLSAVLQLKGDGLSGLIVEFRP